MSGPYDPLQMPPMPDQPGGSQLVPDWRATDPARGPMPTYPPPAPGAPSGPPPGGYTGHPGHPAGPTQPAYMPPTGPAPWGPGPTSQAGPMPAGQWRPEPRGQWDGWSQGPQPQMFPELEPEEPRQPLSPLVIAAGVVMAMLLVAIAGAGIAYTQYRAPASAAVGFCNHLVAQDYGATYEDLSTTLQAQYAADAFVASAREADKLLGAVTDCTAASSGSGYRFGLGQGTAQVAINLTRAQAGSFSEVVTLRTDHGRWRLVRLDASLMGMDLAPLVAVDTVCVELRAHDYASLYASLDAHARAGTTQDDFVRQGGLHEQIDGAVASCEVLSVSKASVTSSLSVTLSVGRPRTVTEQGTVTLLRQDGTWRVDTFAGNLLGSDLRPLTVGARFCSALVAGDYAAAYALLTDNGKGGQSEQQFAYSMSNGGLLTWTGCTPDYTSFKAVGGTASYTANMQAVAPAYGVSAARGVQLSFVQEGDRWLLDSAVLVY